MNFFFAIPNKIRTFVGRKTYLLDSLRIDFLLNHGVGESDHFFNLTNPKWYSQPDNGYDMQDFCSLGC